MTWNQTAIFNINTVELHTCIIKVKYKYKYTEITLDSPEQLIHNIIPRLTDAHTGSVRQHKQNKNLYVRKFTHTLIQLKRLTYKLIV